MLEYVTHKNHPGVRAPMRQQEALDRHLEGGWKLELETVPKKVQGTKPAPKKRRTRKPRS